MQEPDPETIRRAQAGDLECFEALVRGCQADAWRLAYHLTRDRTAADDVTQEAFLRVFRAIGSYRGEHQFASWLLRIVRNCVTDSYQRIKRDRVLRNLDASLSACQLGITLASLGLGWVGEPVFAALLKPLMNLLNVESQAARETIAFVVGFSALTFLHITAGEQAPNGVHANNDPASAIPSYHRPGRGA